MSPPRLVLAGTHNDAVTSILGLALAAAMKRRDRGVVPFSVGAPLVPPGVADRLGVPHARMLDPWTAGSEWIVPLFLHGMETASARDLAIVSGRTALHDTAVGRVGHGMVATVSALLAAPVVLVVDAERAGRSTAAMVHGFATFDRDVSLAGVLLTGVRDGVHRDDVAAAIAALGLPVMGALPLGSVRSGLERMDPLGPTLALGPDDAGELERLVRDVETHVDLGVLERLADEALSLAGRPWSPVDALRNPAPATSAPMLRPGAEIGRDEDDLHPSVPQTLGAGPARRTFRGSLRAVKGGRHRDDGAGSPPAEPMDEVGATGDSGVTSGRGAVKIAVCHFGADGSHPENLEVLGASGLDLVRVDLASDEHLPDGISGIVCVDNGGFSTVLAAATNDSVLRELSDALSLGVALYAEAAGTALLSRSIDGRPMLDLAPFQISTDQRVDALVTGRARHDATIASLDDELRGTVHHALRIETVDQLDQSERVQGSPGTGPKAGPAPGPGARALLPFATWEPLWHLTGNRMHADDGLTTGRMALGTLQLHWAVDTRPALCFTAAAAAAPVWSR